MIQPLSRVKQPDGIECPACGCADLRVYYTRKTPKRIVRVRICNHCERRIRTVERIG